MAQQLLGLLPLQLADQPAVATAFFILAITVVVWLFLKLFGPTTKGNFVVLVGPCGAGKTTLFYQLKDGTQHLGAVSSMQENEGSCQVRNDKDKVIGTVKLVDVPGHPRLRHKLEQHLKDAMAVIFMIDAADITPHKTEAAEELFEVLTHPTIAKKRTSIVLACNKMDLDTQAHSVDFIKRTLEKQLDTMRKTRMALSSEASKANVLGKSDKPFSLSALRNPVTMASISAEGGDVLEVHSFLSKVLKY